jgi:type II secretory pathway component HofQ
MAAPVLRGLSGCLAALLFLGVASAAMQRPASESAGPSPGDKRVVYFVKHGLAADLAAALRPHYKGDADVQPVAAGNCLLIRATPAVSAEIMNLLGRLDRQPLQVAVEVLIVEAAAKADKSVAVKELTGSADKVRARLEALKAKGQITGFKRIRLRGLEHQKATATEQASTPSVVGAVRALGGRGGGAGPMARTVTYRSLGTSVTVTPQVTAANQIVLDLKVEDSRLNSRDGVVIDDSDKQAPVRAPLFSTSLLTTRLRVPAGQVVLARGDESASKEAGSQNLILVTAQIVEGAGSGKQPR